MAKIDDNIWTIQRAMGEFVVGVNETQQYAMDALLSYITDLDYSKSGGLKPSRKNLTSLASIKTNLEAILNERGLAVNSDLIATYDNLESIAKNYYSSIVEEFNTPAGLNVIKEASIQSLMTGLGSNGVNGTIVSEVSNILYDGMQGHMNRNDLIRQVNTYMVGNKETLGHLERYSKQIADDSINQYDAGVDKSITDSLGFEWFQYIGGVIDTTRPFCKGLSAQRYIHISEFDKASRGILRNQTVSKTGMIKGTTGDNLQLYRGGWQCRHKFRGVTEKSVPVFVRKQVLEESTTKKEQKFIDAFEVDNFDAYDTDYSNWYYDYNNEFERKNISGSNWTKSTQGREMKGIWGWTGDDSQRINNYMLDVNHYQNKSLNHELKYMSKGLKSYIKKAPKYNGTLYRGSKHSIEYLNKRGRLTRNNVGDIETFKGFKNATSDFDVASQYAHIDRFQGTSQDFYEGLIDNKKLKRLSSVPNIDVYKNVDIVQMDIIKSKSAVGVYKTSDFADEFEYLFAPETNFKIVETDYFYNEEHGEILYLNLIEEL